MSTLALRGEVCDKSGIMTQWRLKKGADRRFRSGHPWVYSNELYESPKGLEPGAPVELVDAGGAFLARGYGNPSSLIAFRALSRDPLEQEPMSGAAIHQKLLKARSLREKLGLSACSHRLCFAEADGLPGLIIDRYKLAPRSPASQVFVVQAHTAGADRMLPAVLEALQQLSTEKCAIIVSNDVAIRKLEGLQPEEPRVALEVPGQDLAHARIVVPSVAGTDSVEFEVDLVGGQKTGFFLDQLSNIQLAASRLSRIARGKIRILDLCCYVGQWSAQLARFYKGQGLEVEVLAVDASSSALSFAKRNIEAQGARCEMLRGDVLKDLTRLEGESFDLVVCDPPALIKGRKDIPQGTHAYLQLNTQAFRLVKEGGAVVSCSCSALLDEDSFERTLSKAAQRNQVKAQWVGRGGQAPDHPVLLEFPEGRYLKAWIGICQKG